MTWKLSVQQFFWLVLYAAVFPFSLFVAPSFDNWVFTVGALISLPLLPLGVLAYWGLPSSLDQNVVLLLIWLINFLLAYPMFVQYRAYRSRNKSGTRTVVYSVLRVLVIVITVVLLFRLFVFSAP